MAFPRLVPRNLTARVLIAITIGIIIGTLWPATGVALRPLGDTFVNLVKMVIAPLIFLTIVTGIAQMADFGRMGRIGLLAFVAGTLTGAWVWVSGMESENARVHTARFADTGKSPGPTRAIRYEHADNPTP